ncbi:MAG: hypothetical protein KF779_02785 [Hyphomonadaceae bacterium]|nr:hypothetical protein [Hyphomonadaceae bacterium]MCA8885506.1 hypothetical protein [Hyphomonadaceae bacterium]
MRKLMMACLIGLAALQGVVLTSQALAQQGQQHGKGKDKGHPSPPPPPRCPDLGVGTTAYMTEVPGGPPLAPNEVAVSWQVRNDGNTPFVAATPEDTSVALEYTTAAGPTRIAITPAITNLDDAGRVSLGYAHAVRGVVRGVIPPEAAGRRLRLRLVYASEGTRRGIPDCNEANNIAPLPHPPATPTAAPTGE